MSIPKVIRTSDYPIVQTKAGKLHGFQQDDTFIFRGIRYATAERFMPPKPVEPWEGVKDAKSYGRVSPLMPSNRPVDENDPWAMPNNDFEEPHTYWPESENCQFLNVWTPSISDGKKRPVMFWLHGGGFAAGSSIEMDSYNGLNLSAYGDVVVVTINHRLNCIGYLDLSAFGERYKYSGIVGMLDIVEALRWVHENIAAFGGDPDNVMIFGQSGGGGKVCALMQMPVADGLYHKAAIQSGVMGPTRGGSAEAAKQAAQEYAAQVVSCLGLNGSTIQTIETLPYAVLAAACNAATEKLAAQGKRMGMMGPVYVEGTYLGTFAEVGFRPEVKDIPVLVGSTIGEFSGRVFLGDKTKYSDEERMAMLRDKFGDQAESIAAQFRAAYPDKDLLYALSTDTMCRLAVMGYAEARAAAADAPVYPYLLSLVVPHYGGVTAWHCAEIPFVFRNIACEPAHCTGYEYADRLTDDISNAWLVFARTGNPGTEALPWPAFGAAHETMYFDTTSAAMPAKDEMLVQQLSAFGRMPF